MWLAAAILWGFGSLGEPTRVDLRWETVPGCPDRTRVGEELSTLLGAGTQQDASEAVGRLTGDRGSYRLHLEVVVAGQREVRELRANDCTVLSRAGVLVVAVTLDALATARLVDSASEPIEAAELQVSLVPEPVAAPATGAEPRTPAAPVREESPVDVTASGPGSGPGPRAWARGATLGVGGGVSGGLTPGLAGGLEGELGWRLGPARITAAGFHWFSRSIELQPGVGIEAALSGGSIRGCLAFERARVEVPMCMGLDLAAMHGGGIGSAVRRRDVLDLWVGASAGTGVVAWVSARIALWARADAVLSLRRTAMDLQIEGASREVFRMAPVATRLLIGPMVRLW